MDSGLYCQPEHHEQVDDASAELGPHLESISYPLYGALSRLTDLQWIEKTQLSKFILVQKE